MANDIARYMSDMDRAFDSIFGYGGRKFPPVDIKENREGYEIRAALAGYDMDSIHVYVENHVLSISGEMKTSTSEDSSRKYLVKERSAGSFSRSFTLPEDADEEKLEASFKNGVLTLTLAKKAKEEPRKIEVRIN